jgi:flagellar biosynthesis protein FlhF
MQVKVYTGSSTTAVLAGIKAELGPDAVILDTRETSENGKAQVRITAAVDQGARPDGNGGSGKRPPAEAWAGTAGSASYGGVRGDEAAMPPGWKLWHEEWSTIKSHLLTLMKPELQLEKLTPRQRLAVEFLQREGVDDTVMLALYTRLLPQPGASILAPLADLVPVRAWGASTWPQTLHLIGGPFGTGKTTAAVRLALLLRKTNPGLRIALLNADCERGGGRLVLRNYAELSEFA